MTVKVYIWYPALKKSSVLSAISFRNVGHVSIQVKDMYISHRPSLKHNNDRIHFSEYIVQFFSRVLLYGIDIDSEIDTKQKQSFKKVSNDKDYTKKFINFEPVERADSTNYTYEEECRVKERNADEIISVDGLNEEKMLNYYLTIKELKYHPFKMNCSTFIADIIKSSLDCSSKLCSFCSLRDSSLYINKISKIFSILIFLFPLLPLIPLFLLSILTLSPLSLKNIAYRFNVSGINFINFPVWTPTLIEYFLKEIDKNNGIEVCFKSYNSFS